MHTSVMEWVASMVDRLNISNLPTLEVGSLHVNGSVRGYFTNDYVGVDIVPGDGVDVVVSPTGPLPNRSHGWPVIVSTETLEHVELPWDLLHRCAEVASWDAHLLLTCRGFNETWSFPYHAPTHEGGEDLWRYSVRGLTCLLSSFGWTPREVLWDPMYPGVFAWAQRIRRF